MIFGAEHLEGIDPVPQTRAERSRGPASRPPARSPHLFWRREKNRDGDARWGWGGESHSAERAEAALRAAIGGGGLSELEAALAAAPREVREGGVGVEARARCDRLLEEQQEAES